MYLISKSAEQSQGQTNICVEFTGNCITTSTSSNTCIWVWVVLWRPLSYLLHRAAQFKGWGLHMFRYSTKHSQPRISEDESRQPQIKRSPTATSAVKLVRTFHKLYKTFSGHQPENTRRSSTTCAW